MVPFAGMFALVPDEAEACSPDPCFSSATFLEDLQPLNAGAIPIDGVLVLQATGRNVDDADLLATIDLEVSREGVPVAGAIETTQAEGILVWRPAAPLVPGEHALNIHFENIDDEYGYNCGPASVDSFAQVTVVDQMAQAIGQPQIEHKQSVELFALRGLDDLVCCDGAFPQNGDYCGYSDYDSYWSEGECASHRGEGFLRVDIALDTQLDPATSGVVLRTFFVDETPISRGIVDQSSTQQDNPFCTHVELQNLASGLVVVSEPQCHGDEVADLLGPQPMDAKAALAGKCSGPLYTCEVIEGPLSRWDPANCTPFAPEEETDSGPTTSESESQSDSDPTAGPGSDSDPTAGPGSDTTPTSGSAGEGGSDSAGDGGQDGLVEHGCACDSGTGDPTALLGLLGLGLLGLRRRE